MEQLTSVSLISHIPVRFLSFVISFIVSVAVDLDCFSQSCAVRAKVENSDGPLDNPTWQTEWKTAPLTKVQLCEHENQTEDFVSAGRLHFLANET